MAVFQHPHLTRGIVKTAKGSFVVSRGLVRAPEEIGDWLGWRRVDAEPPVPARRRDASTPGEAKAPLDPR